jgi:phasin
MTTDPMSFEIPQEMRNFVEQSVTQAQQAFAGFVTAANSAVAGMEDRANAARVGARDVTGKAMDYAQRNVVATFEHAQNLIRAKSPDEVVRLQSDFVKAQMQALNEQARDLAQLASQTAAKATKI